MQMHQATLEIARFVALQATWLLFWVFVLVAEIEPGKRISLTRLAVFALAFMWGTALVFVPWSVEYLL